MSKLSGQVALTPREKKASPGPHSAAQSRPFLHPGSRDAFAYFGEESPVMPNPIASRADRRGRIWIWVI
ncbi:hypothetical protein BST61_g2870 [Cercospora zeina]